MSSCNSPVLLHSPTETVQVSISSEKFPVKIAGHIRTNCVMTPESELMSFINGKTDGNGPGELQVKVTSVSCSGLILVVVISMTAKSGRKCDFG